MNKLSTAERCQIIRALVEGNSINSVVRMTGRSNNTILKLLVDIGTACQKFHDKSVKGLAVKRVQVDEIWNFCYSKEKNVPAEFQGQRGYGDVWTFVGIDADTKLIISWLCGRRTAEYARDFMLDLEARIVTRIQLTSDGLNSYPFAVADAFENGVDYAQLIKIYGPDKSTATRYSPPALTAVETKMRSGNPDPAHISTSFVERCNLTIRMSMRRFTRLTNGFSKKYDNLKHAVALNFVYYNYCRTHQTLRVTPAMEAGLADHVWDIAELISLI